MSNHTGLLSAMLPTDIGSQRLLGKSPLFTPIRVQTWRPPWRQRSTLSPSIPSLCPPVGWEAVLPSTGLPRILRQPHKEIRSCRLHCGLLLHKQSRGNRTFLASDWLQLAARHQNAGGFWVLIPGSRCCCCCPAERAPGTPLARRLTEKMASPD